MKRSKNAGLGWFLGGVLCMTFTGVAAAHENRDADQYGGAPDDCTAFMIDSSEDDTLTQAEKVAELDEALYDSVDRYDACVQKVAAEDNSGGGGGGGAGAGSAGEAQTGSENGGLSTTENTLEPFENPVSQNPDQQTSQSGAVPKDIPSADNDSVLQQQIRAAAMAEQDPVKKQKLWDLYRKYLKK